MPRPDVAVPAQGTPSVSGSRVSLGPDFLERRDGYWLMVHQGDPVAMGARHAALGEFLTQRVEDSMFSDFNGRIPIWIRPLLLGFLMWQYRHMPWQVPPEQQEELWGFSATYADRHSFPLSSYRRGIYYHALHDITQELIGNPWVDPSVTGACTGFAASGEASADGHLIVGRNLDFEVFPLFDTEKVVHIHARDGAVPVVSVSWMAMSGVVTGMNADGIWMSLDAARSEGRNRRGAPVALRVRSILERARSLDDVERLMGESHPMVTDIYLAGDGKTGQAAVFERGQTRMGRRDMERGRLVAANHLLSDVFRGDEGDAWLRDNSSTISRHMRMEELLADEPLTALRGQQILRDRRGPGGLRLPPGHRNSVDALIATHSVVADLTDRVLWVSEAPHTQGPYHAIDLLAELDAAGIDTAPWRAGLAPGARAWERPAGVAAAARGPEGMPAALPSSSLAPTPPTDLPAGDLLLSGGLEALERHRGLLDDARSYIADERWDLARDMADRAEALVPGTPEAAWTRGEACRLAGDAACARRRYDEYLRRYPPLSPAWHRVVGWMDEHGGTPEIARPDRP